MLSPYVCLALRLFHASLFSFASACLSRHVFLLLHLRLSYVRVMFKIRFRISGGAVGHWVARAVGHWDESAEDREKYKRRTR
jgi:hypothetical protein